MPLLQMPWLWFFAAFALGIAAGWLAYAVAAMHWAGRPRVIATGVIAAVVLVVAAEVVPARYGARLDLAVILAGFIAAGCIVGRALRDLAEFLPAATRPGAMAPPSGSYLFRHALAGAGTGIPFMRTSGSGGLRPPIGSRGAAVRPTPGAGGYTFPKLLASAEATTSRRVAPGSGSRLSWTSPGGADTALPSRDPEFTGSRPGYVFPVAAAAAPLAGVHRAARTRGGQYRHWTWRAADAAGRDDPATQATSAASGDPAA